MTMEERVSAVERTVSDVKIRVDDLFVRLAVKDERERHIDLSLKNISEEVIAIKTLANRIAWLVMAALLGGVMQFIINGGLSNAP